jgi:hypothetical protein
MVDSQARKGVNMNYSDFIKKHNLSMKCSKAYDNPNMDDDKWKKSASHYSIVIEKREHCYQNLPEDAMTLFYSMGSAHKKQPTLEQVLECLAMDSSTINNCQSFEQWASDLGYDEDSKKAEKTYSTVKEQSEKLKKLLGEDAYQELLSIEQ